METTVRMLFVMDPIGTINIKKDTSFALMLAAQARGHEVWYCRTDDLTATATGTIALVSRVEVRRVAGDFVTVHPATTRPLNDFGVVWMRRDPPVNEDFTYATLLLEAANPATTLVVNRPAGLRRANEKVFILEFPSLITPTIVTKQRSVIEAFLAEQGGRAVLKPLDLMGGAGIFLLRDDDANLGTILEQSTRYGQEYVMVQRFLPQAAEGDKRILLIDGEPLGALLRVPKAGEFRGNLAVGGSAVETTLTERDHEIVATVRDRLRAEGLWFVGLDVIGGCLTEVNVTSPTGIQEAERFSGEDLSSRVIAWAEQAAPAGARG